MGSTLLAGSPLNAPPSRSSASTDPLTLQGRGRSFTIHGAAGSQVAASGEPAVGLARAMTFETCRVRDHILGRTRFKIRLGRRHPGTNRPEETHTSPSMPTGGEDCTSDYQLTVEDMEGDLDMTVRENKLDEREVYEEWEEDEEDQDVDFIDLMKMIYKEEEEKEEEETDDNGDDDNDDNYYDDGEREPSSDSLSQSENSDVDMIHQQKLTFDPHTS
ncbi:hypothetical protein B9Z19DRAFT_1138936 [Tuber borchii]|uniref:Uncharacterized protein n=1 Tax=Tuber borchii TaxID=42251 RepID=A0A2T6Z9L2_TUBBO|nr:hypothetical protein B9Z19DRAFT_1138936 [Tuber borchii]